MCMSMSMSMCMFICICICICICMCICICVCICIRIRMYTYVCVYMCIYIYRYIYSIYRIKAGGSPELPGTLSLVMCYKSHGIEMGGGGVWGCNNVMWTIVGLRLVETLRVLLR